MLSEKTTSNANVSFISKKTKLLNRLEALYEQVGKDREHISGHYKYMEDLQRFMDYDPFHREPSLPSLADEFKLEVSIESRIRDLENIVALSVKNASSSSPTLTLPETPLHKDHNQGQVQGHQSKVDVVLLHEKEKVDMDIETSNTPKLDKMQVFEQETEPSGIALVSESVVPLTKDDALVTLTGKSDKLFNQFLMRIGANVKENFNLASSPAVDWSNVDRYYLYLCLKHFPLFSVMQEATKVLTTKDWILAREEMEIVKAMEMIERLKDENRWSCRQRKKFQMPMRQKTRWDLVLEESKWMSIDFSQERRWKICLALELAHSAKSYIASKFTDCVRDLDGNLISLFSEAKWSTLLIPRKTPNSPKKSPLKRILSVDDEKMMEVESSVGMKRVYSAVLESPSTISDSSLFYNGAAMKTILNDQGVSIYSKSYIDNFGPDETSHSLQRFHMNNVDNRPISYDNSVTSKRIKFSEDSEEEEAMTAVIAAKETGSVSPWSIGAFERFIVKENSRPRLPRARSSTLFNYGTSFGEPLKVEISVPPLVNSINPNQTINLTTTTTNANANANTTEKVTSEQDWLVEEDDLLLGIVREYQSNWHLISDYVNSCSHSLKSRSATDCRNRFLLLDDSNNDQPQNNNTLIITSNSNIPNDNPNPKTSVALAVAENDNSSNNGGLVVDTSNNNDGNNNVVKEGENGQSAVDSISHNPVSPTSLSSSLPSKNDVKVRKDPVMRNKLLKQEWKKRQTGHIHLFSSLKRIISKFRPLRPSNALKKVSFMAHPSHDSAVKKTGISVNKVSTPTDLAMRRLQRTRALAEAQHSFLLGKGGLGGSGGGGGSGISSGGGGVSSVVGGGGPISVSTSSSSTGQFPLSSSQRSPHTVMGPTSAVSSGPSPISGVARPPGLLRVTAAGSNTPGTSVSVTSSGAGTLPSPIPITSTINTSNAGVSMIVSRGMRASSSNSPVSSPKPPLLSSSSSSGISHGGGVSVSTSIRPHVHHLHHMHSHLFGSSSNSAGAGAGGYTGNSGISGTGQSISSTASSNVVSSRSYTPNKAAAGLMNTAVIRPTSNSSPISTAVRPPANSTTSHTNTPGSAGSGKKTGKGSSKKDSN